VLATSNATPADPQGAIFRAVKIATWNVNGIRARIEAVTGWLEHHEPDVLAMQETKVVDDDFPFEELSRLGYQVTLAGQRAYNGVAIASRSPLTDVKLGLHDDPADAERRLIAATTAGVRVFCVYVPNGKSVELPSFREKLRFFERLRMTLDLNAGPDTPLVLLGDFNVAREARDVYDPEAMRGRLHFHPEEHAALDRLLAFGLFDAYRCLHEEGGRYSWWDYRSGDFRNNRGLRIDYLFVTEPLRARLKSAVIDIEPRRAPKPSDHTPVLIELE
jgi:exodeoxyribonuclease-3